MNDALNSVVEVCRVDLGTECPTLYVPRSDAGREQTAERFPDDVPFVGRGPDNHGDEIKGLLVEMDCLSVDTVELKALRAVEGRAVPNIGEAVRTVEF